MNSEALTSYDRLVSALSFRKPGRVPVFLPLTMHGAKELGLPLQEYFSKAEYVAEGQLRLQRKFGHDALFLEFYAVAEAAAFGAEPLFFEDGPPNMGAPPLRDERQIVSLETPDPLGSVALTETLRAIDICAAEVKGRVPIVGVALPPFSLPALLLGLEAWLDLLLFGSAKVRDHLLRVCADFCIRWANLQLDAGADAIVLPDAVSSTTMITREQYIDWSFPLQTSVIALISGPVVLASVGRVQAIVDLLPQTGAKGVLVTASDDLSYCQKVLGNQVAVFGNVNNIAMLEWDAAQARSAARSCLQQAGSRPGFVLAPQWEVPYGVSDDALSSIVDAATEWQAE